MDCEVYPGSLPGPGSELPSDELPPQFLKQPAAFAAFGAYYCLGKDFKLFLAFCQFSGSPPAPFSADCCADPLPVVDTFFNLALASSHPYGSPPDTFFMDCC